MRPFAFIRDNQTRSVYVIDDDKPLRVGRAVDSNRVDVSCRNAHVSRVHCVLKAVSAGELEVSDQSSYGTFINGRKIEGSARARSGDQILLGHDYVLLVLPPLGETISESAPLLPSPPSSENAGPKLIADRYELLEIVGRGGMGVVWKSYDRSRGESCAVKLLNASMQDSVGRFFREARIGAQLGHHPGLVRVRDFGPGHNLQQFYMAMDLVEGESLAAHIARRRCHPAAAAILVAKAARIVSYAHVAGVIHRDIKPANIILQPDHELRIMDFGIAKRDGTTVQTSQGTMLGTLGYMSPEQMRDASKVDARADIYGLGAVLFALISGEPPVVGRNPRELILSMMGEGARDLKIVAPEVDPTMHEICRRALALDPGRSLSNGR